MKKILTLLLLTSLLSSVHGQTFCVDMNDYSGAFTTVFISGSFNGWCGGCNPLDDSDGDGVWCGSAGIANGGEYKFQVDEWTAQEALTDGAACTMTTIDGADTFINRVYAGGDPGTVCWNSCSACPVDDTASTGTVIESVTTASVPTMSEWGLMIFFLLVMNLSVVFLRRLELVTAK